MKLFFGIILILILALWGAMRIVTYVGYQQGCESYLKNAADANSIELAKERLTVAIAYIENRGWTSGYSSILYRTEDNNVGFWYKNLKTAVTNLDKVKPDASELEKSNELMKLRETLLDHKDRGEEVTAPDGISIYPSNVVYCLFGILALILAVVGCVLIVEHLNDY